MTDMAVPAPALAGATTGFRFRDAYLSTAVERAAVDPSDLIHLSFDISLAVNIVLAVIPRLAQFKEEIGKLPLDHELIGGLEAFAQAAGHAQALYTIATAPPEELQAVYDDAAARRAALRSDAANLAAHGLLNPDAVGAIKSDVGYRNVGYDLMSLVSLMRNAGARIAGRSATLPEDLDRAELVANQLVELAARREARQQVDPSVAENRLRALSLMVKAYSQVRRAMYFIRWDFGDAEKLAPSVYTAKSSPKRKENGEDADNATTPQPGADAQPPPIVPGAAPAQPTVAGGQGGDPFAGASSVR